MSLTTTSTYCVAVFLLFVADTGGAKSGPTGHDKPASRSQVVTGK